ncbi:unnamed protein product [Somion occarium]|uniref:DNA replication regulator Sld3 C-terminal domain-containing protein n=1 Tax=Somion occarium TaxID=3059160 RepID=A0ABP1D4U9_9APHY
MLHVPCQNYSLVTECPVKWTATQEKSLAKDFPVEVTKETPETCVSRVYQQFLWFPESIAPLQHLVPALLRTSLSAIPSSSSISRDPLRQILQSLLLTPRSASQKYQNHVTRLLEDEDAIPDLEANLLWYAVKYEKIDVDENADERQQEVAEEKWKSAWLERVERREVLIQIILHFLILTRPEPLVEDRGHTPDPQPLSQSPRKRKRKTPPPDNMFSNDEVEDRLEAFMDKLCMWQLTNALDDIVASNTSTSKQAMTASSKGKQKAVDERDWMQIFCEDVIEPVFKSTLPSYCELLRSKVFPSSPFSDDSDFDGFLPASDNMASKRLRASDSRSSSRRQSPSQHSHPEASNDRILSRSRSLSQSLEKERERSRSVSVGPGNMKKPALTREVSMKTVFKGKAQEQARRKEEERSRAARATKKPVQQPQVRQRKDQGRTLVQATPVKPKGKAPGAAKFSQTTPKLPMLSVKEEIEEEGDWRPLSNSPDILLLGSNSGGWDDDDENEELDIFGTPVRKRKAGSGTLLVGATPTKVSS